MGRHFFSWTQSEFEKFAELYQEIKLPFWCQTRPETINKKRLTLLNEMGCARISFGVEHGNEEFRKKHLNRMMPNSVITDMKLGRFHNIEVEDEVTSIFKYKDGLKGIFTTTTGEAPGVNRLEIASDFGLVIYEDNCITWKKLSGSSTNFIQNSKTLFEKPSFEMFKFDFPYEDDPHIEHNRILQNFTNFLIGKENLYVAGNQGINSVELINAMILSGLNNKEVELPLNEEDYENKLKKLIDKNYEIK